MSRPQYLLASLFLSTGAALIVYIVAGISLLAAAALIATVAAIIGAVVWRRLNPDQKINMRQLIWAGTIAGFFATGAYDASRLFLIEVTGIQFWPFDIFNIFGQALVGAGFSGPWVRFLGLIYHFANGIGFAIAYTIPFGKRGIWAGIAWAMVLELFMVTIYPGWLDINAIREFTQVSIFGHIIYGVFLGFISRWLLIQWEKDHEPAAE